MFATRSKKMDTAVMEHAANFRTNTPRCAPRLVAEISVTMTMGMTITMTIDTPVDINLHEMMAIVEEATTAVGTRTAEKKEYATSIGTLVCALLDQVVDLHTLTPQQITVYKPVAIMRETLGQGPLT